MELPNPSRKLVLAGGSGVLGRLLADWFTRLDWQVVVLTRQPLAQVGLARAVTWDGCTIGDWAAELNDSHAAINLAGLSVNCRYHARNRRAILSSRVDSTRVLGQAIHRCSRPPSVWLNSTTATIYKHSLDRPMDDVTGVIGSTPEAKDQFSVDVAEAWERAFEDAATRGMRKVALRTAMVFSTPRETVYRVLRRLVRLGLGGAMDGGQQWVSWIHQDDFCRAIEWLIDRQEVAGAVNLAAPHPLTNREMMKTLREVLHAPIGLPASRWMLEIGALVMRTETELVIKSRRVVPARLLADGFTFRFPELRAAIVDLEKRLTLANPRKSQAAG